SRRAPPRPAKPAWPADAYQVVVRADRESDVVTRALSVRAVKPPRAGDAGHREIGLLLPEVGGCREGYLCACGLRAAEPLRHRESLCPGGGHEVLDRAGHEPRSRQARCPFLDPVGRDSLGGGEGRRRGRSAYSTLSREPWQLIRPQHECADSVSRLGAGAG